MKFLSIALFLLLLNGCIKHQSNATFDFSALESEANVILEKNQIQLNNLPSAIRATSPENVVITDQGLFIRIDSQFVEESGLFVPRKSYKVSTETGNDPEFKKLSGNVYSYIIRG